MITAIAKRNVLVRCACVIAVLFTPPTLTFGQQTPAAPPIQTKPSQPGSAQVPQFDDTPQFTVSGVTDASNVGGHGSAAAASTRNALAKEAASLSNPGLTSQLAISEAAASALRAQLAREPNNAEAHHSLAQLDESLGDFLSAVHEYQRAAELNSFEAYLFDWGSELLLHHAPEPAIEVFSKGNRAFPSSTRMLIGLGASLFARGFDDQAIQRMNEASTLHPNDATPYLFLGKMLEAYTSPPEALVAALHRFAELHPESAEANYYYATALWKRHKSPQDASEIEALLNHALREKPGFAPARLQLGILDFQKPDYPGAISQYQQAIQSDPRNEEAHYRLAQAYRQVGEEEKAKAELKLYEQITKESAEQAETERHALKQFLYTLRDQPSAQKP